MVKNSPEAQRAKQMGIYEREMSESPTKRKKAKAYVSAYIVHKGETRLFIKATRRTFVYNFTVNGQQYEGYSKNYKKQRLPNIGDSIWVYYKEEDPNVNLWVGLFE